MFQYGIKESSLCNVKDSIIGYKPKVVLPGEALKNLQDEFLTEEHAGFVLF